MGFHAIRLSRRIGESLTVDSIATSILLFSQNQRTQMKWYWSMALHFAVYYLFITLSADIITDF